MSAIAAGWLVLLYVAVLMFWPFKTVDILNNPFPVLNSPIKAGDIIKWEVHSCRHTGATAEVVRTLIADDVTPGTSSLVRIPLNNDSSRLEKGCTKHITANTVIPVSTPPGDYHIEINISYQVNPFKKVERQYETQSFQVLESDKMVITERVYIYNTTDGTLKVDTTKQPSESSADLLDQPLPQQERPGLLREFIESLLTSVR